MKLGIGCDHNGLLFKETIKQHLLEKQFDLVDYGCHSGEEVDYPDVAFQVAGDISEGMLDRGILICGTGIGVAIAAGKFPGIRAALCHDTYSAERAQKSNNAQILTMGAQVIGSALGKKIVDAWLDSTFEGGGSSRKIQKIMDKETELLKLGMNENKAVLDT